MNLISCEKCGVVLDANKLRFPVDIYEIDGSIDGEKAAWNGSDYVAKIECPVCQSEVLESA